ncbi:organic cation transporter protein-like isoform X3 [Periplaneta americana]|uniref:organic cation transporter protein-like isoform X3 n=1 Tax=Periplaneta americana TaxID=6978 RepID=UPI0037E94E08
MQRVQHFDKGIFHLPVMQLAMDLDLDKILDEVGHFGRFQAINYLLVGFPILLSAMFALSYIFTAGDLDYRCRIPECDTDSSSFRPNWLQNAVPFEESTPSRCLRFEHQNVSSFRSRSNERSNCTSEMFNQQRTIKCYDWVYDGEETTILNEWGLTCEENEWKLAMVGSVNNIGQFIGYPLAGFFSDRLLPESVRWLLTMGKIEEARNTIIKAAKRNGVKLSEETLNKFEMNSLCEHKSFHDVSDEEEEKSAKEILKQVMRSKILLLRVVNCSFCWATITFVFFGLSLTSVSVGGNKFTSFTLAALIELPAYAVFFFTMDRFGRKATLCVSLVVSGISCISFAFVPTDMEWMQMLLFLAGKFSITISFTVVYVYTAEMFPTELRHSLLGVCAMVGRIGSMIAPQTPLLERYLESLPLLLFGGMSIASGLLSLYFPETLNMKLPDTIEEAEQIGRKNGRRRR